MTSDLDQTAQPIPVGHWQDACVLVIEGSMAADFLQGYLTSDTLQLQADHAQPTAVCNVKGRVLANGWAIGLPAAIGVLIHTSMFAATAKFLTPYVNFSKCELCEQPLSVMVNSADASIELLPGINLELLEDAPANADDVSAHLQQRLIEQNIAFVSAPVSEAFLPQMLSLDRIGAVDFDKGCYLGQEIVARAQFRGEVKRQLVAFNWQNEPPVVGDTTSDRDTIINVGANGQGLKVAKV